MLNAIEGLRSVQYQGNPSTEQLQGRRDTFSPKSDPVKVSANTDRVDISKNAQQNLRDKDVSDRGYGMEKNISAAVNATPASTDEEKQDFKAIALIKASKIEVRMPEKPADGNAQTTEQVKSSLAQPKEKAEAPAQKPTLRDKINETAESGKERIKAPDTDNMAKRNVNAVQKGETEQTIEASEEESDNEQVKLTAAQQKGVQTYQQTQNYQNPVNISIAATAV